MMRTSVLGADIAVQSALVLTADQIANPTRSVAMLGRVEVLIRRREEAFGRERLLRTVAGIDAETRVNHVTDYRNFIRTNTWPNSLRPSNLRVFCDEYERSAAKYVKVAFEALDHLAGGNGDLDGIYYRVIASEALRGQFGKRSPTGLDERLEETVTQLAERIGGLGLLDIEGAVTLLGTPGSKTLTAEALMLSDFRDVLAVFPEPPAAGDLGDEPGGSEPVWRYLRRHCRWSLDKLYLDYVACAPSSLAEKIEAAEVFRVGQERERLVMLLEIQSRLGEAEFADLCRIARGAVTLNHMNLTLEPSYSFKGGPGLAHGMILQAAQKAGGHSLPTQEEIQAAKWQLMSEFD